MQNGPRAHSLFSHACGDASCLCWWSAVLAYYRIGVCVLRPCYITMSVAPVWHMCRYSRACRRAVEVIVCVVCLCESQTDPAWSRLPSSGSKFSVRSGASVRCRCSHGTICSLRLWGPRKL